MVIVEEKGDYTNNSIIKSGRSGIFNIALIIAMATAAISFGPAVSIFSTVAPSIQIYDYSRGDLVPFFTIVSIFICGLVIAGKTLGFLSNATLVEYGFQEAFEIGKIILIGSIISVCSYALIILYYLGNGLSEPLFLFAQFGLAINVLNLLVLILITGRVVVERVYDIPEWISLQSAIVKFNNTTDTRKLHGSFIHRISKSEPPENIFDHVRISYTKRINAQVDLCHIKISSDNDWKMIVFDEMNIADMLADFITKELGVAITKSEGRSLSVGMIWRDDESKLHKVVSI